MLTMNEAKKIAEAALDAALGPGEAVILDEDTLGKPYGWVFIYNSRKYFETRHILDGFGGNGPLIVQHNGRVERLGGLQTLEEVEAKRGWRR